jgi:hypothetical protein
MYSGGAVDVEGGRHKLTASIAVASYYGKSHYHNNAYPK